ncbi:hypothetical protein HN51_013124 [Arachis hypogaea]|uniref:FYVE-type domain-containing protein n=1 Tax=Arachis hypogaea TaxID=3818 RepID=A0A445DRQ4_ARAHY|nr:Vacuolar protein sorting-associated protein [Arachis hypogaea]RYR65817.1 hypothetical protein Ahy_A03g011738 isoform A [Arachis hypogaea]
MLEKIGLPPKPSLRGNTWVVDSSHCQGCSSQFTFINRKHHCRRCGGLFCNSCTQQRMVLRGQGDSPVRICEPCKKLEEAARFELRQGRRLGRGNVKSTSRDEDEVLSQILGSGREEKAPSSQKSIGTASSSSAKGFSNSDDSEIQQFVSNDKPDILGIDVGSTTPDELRQQALEEKRKYKILKGEGKSEEALRSFKRGKELERQADSLEIQLRKNRKKMLSSGNLSDIHNKGSPEEVGSKTKSLPHAGKEKDDLMSELRELGWSDMDLHSEDRKPASLSLEGELSSIIGEVRPKTGEEKGSRIDKTEVVALKKKALTLKREGRLAEAKEELKRAKILEKQLEEQELLAEAEDSDDELSALIRSMDSEKEGSNLHDHGKGFDLDGLIHISDDLGANFEVTEEDMMDPELAVALESIGWTEPEQTFIKSQTIDKEAVLSEIQYLKREALNQKRAGNTEEAMASLKKAKLLERGFESEDSTIFEKSTAVQKNMSSDITGNGSDSIQFDERNTNATNTSASKMASKSRLMIQRELLSSKKKALTLRREGKLNEAEEEMRKGADLERQLTELDKASNLKAPQISSTTDNVLHTSRKHSDIHRNMQVEEGSEDDVTDQDMSDPAYLSLLKDLGWNDDSNEPSSSPSKLLKKENDHSLPVSDASLTKNSRAPRKNKGQIQRELLGLKRKALALRREGKAEDAEEVLSMAKALETELSELEAPKNEARVEATMMTHEILNPPLESAIDEESNTLVSEEDMRDPALNSMLVNLGWKDEFEPVTVKKDPAKKEPYIHNSSSGIPAKASRSKGEIQRELLALKRKALALRRQGEIEEAEEVLRMAKSLEAQMEDEKSVMPESSDLQEKPESLRSTVEADKGSDTNIPFLRESGNSVLPPSQPIENKDPLSAKVSASRENLAEKMNTAQTTDNITSDGHSMHSIDRLTSDGSTSSSQTTNPIHLGSSENLNQDQQLKNRVTTKRELTGTNEKPSISKLNAAQNYASMDHLHQDILAHKRKAVTLKREGKLAEAKEELRQAKLLEKSLEDGSVQPITSSANNVPDASHAVKKQESTSVAAKQESTSVASKPLSSRDRFKLQQESLGHKRQALKLRREGRTEEAEAEFEKAKAIETQLEELAAHDANKPDAAEDVTVEDFLDPQLLSALKAIGIEDANVASRGPERQEPVKSNVTKGENSNQERIQLEERIKDEKRKAVNLKRSGKQAEALDALRRAKMYEKKLNSMTSG